MGKLKTKKTFTRPNKENLGITYRGVDVAAYQLSNGSWSYKYRARITAGIGYQKYLGTFQTVNEAAKAYNNEAKRIFNNAQKAKKVGCWNVIQ